MENVSISGLNFGPTAGTARSVVVGGAVCPLVVWESSSLLVCAGLLARDLVVSLGSVDVSLGNQGASIPLSVVGAPVVSVVAPGLSSPGSEVTIVGGEFGRDGGDVSSVSIGGVECDSFTRTSSASITCVVPLGSGEDLPVVVVTAGGLNGSSVFTYDLRIESAVIVGGGGSVLLGGAVGSSLSYNLSISGRSFGSGAGDIVSLSVGGGLCGSVVWVSHTLLYCSVPGSSLELSGVDGSVSLMLSSGQSVSADLVSVLGEPSVDPERTSSLCAPGETMTATSVEARVTCCPSRLVGTCVGVLCGCRRRR